MMGEGSLLSLDEAGGSLGPREHSLQPAPISAELAVLSLSIIYDLHPDSPLGQFWMITQAQLSAPQSCGEDQTSQRPAKAGFPTCCPANAPHPGPTSISSRPKAFTPHASYPSVSLQAADKEACRSQLQWWHQ